MRTAVTAGVVSFKKASDGRRADATLLPASVRGDVTTLVGISTNVARDLERGLLAGESLVVGVGFLVVLGGEDVLADLFLCQTHAHELILAEDDLLLATTALG